MISFYFNFNNRIIWIFLILVLQSSIAQHLILAIHKLEIKKASNSYLKLLLTFILEYAPTKKLQPHHDWSKF